jgi:hypothetical protein
MNNTKKLMPVLALLIVFGFFLADPVSAHRGGRPEENGWTESNGQPYLVLVAEDHYELGLLQGQYLAEEILYADALLDQMCAQYGLSIEMLIHLSRYYESFIPEEYISEMQGMADALPVSYDRILLQNCWLDIYYGQLVPAQALAQLQASMGCSSFAVDSRAFDVVGQTLDFGYIFSPAIFWLKYRVGDGPTVFCPGLGAGKVPAGKSDYVMASTNLVQTVAVGGPGMPYTIRARYAFENAKNAADFLEKVVCTTSSWNYIAADVFFHTKFTTPTGVETIPGTTLYEEGSDYVVRTNTFVSDELKPYLIDPTYSLDRQERCEELIEADRGRFTLRDAGDMLSDDLISREPNPHDPTATATVCFFWSDGISTYFGEGNPRDAEWGRIIH